MPDLPTNPGVYVEDVLKGIKPIEGVSTSVTAFVGRAKSGPIETPVQIYNFGEYENNFGGLDKRSYMSHAVRLFFLNGGNSAWIVRLAKNALYAKCDLSDAEGKHVLSALAQNKGSEGNKIKLYVDYNTELPDLTFNLFADYMDRNDVSIIKSEAFRNLLTDESNPRYAGKIVNGNEAEKSKIINIKMKADACNRPEETVNDAGYNNGVYLTGGSEDNDIDNDFDVFIGNGKSDKGIYVLENAGLFNILCLPGINDPRILQTAAEYCRKKRALLIIDSPAYDTKPEQMKELVKVSGLPESSNAVVYYPWITIRDPLSGEDINIPPCGAVAGVYSRTDAERGVWKAPAGIEAVCNGAIGISCSLTDEDQGTLNPLGINCIRRFNGNSIVCWGAVTLIGSDEQSSEYKYIPVRRMALYIEESLYRGLQWTVFEPNDEPLWAAVRLSVKAFMFRLFKSGAFTGIKTSDAYFVKCDAETTTLNNRNNGLINLQVGFAPLKPAEFVIVNIQLRSIKD